MIPDLCSLGPAPAGDRPVLLIAQAAYHLAELEPLRGELAERGVGSGIVAPVPPRRALNRLRPGVRRFRELLEASGSLGGTEEGAPRVDGSGAVVVMNDWGTTRPIVERARAAAIPVFAWVEGVQDFADVDTGRARRPYRHVDHVFCLGEYDHDQLDGVARSIVGSNRLRALWQAQPSHPDELFVTVNTNFTYGVHTEHRRAWLTGATRACRHVGVPFAISRHVAERGPMAPWRVSSEPVGDLLARSTTLVSRFSTLCYEALVRGVGLVYHNPHGESVPTFSDPMGAFSVTREESELIAAIEGQTLDLVANRDRARRFLSRHLRLEAGPDPASVAADVITSACRT